MADPVPTLAGYTAFCRNVAKIPVPAMPDGDPGFADSFLFAQQWVPCQLQTVNPYLYTVAVYNMGVSILVNFQPDQVGQTYFADLRKAFKTDDFVAGVVSASADEGTSVSLTVGEQLSNLSAQDLQWLKDPFGRRAMMIMGELGPAPWGLS